METIATIAVALEPDTLNGGRRTAGDDPAPAIAEVLNAHRQALMRVVMTYEAVADRQDDLYQEIAFAIWKALPSFERRSSLKTFILRIAHNRCVNHVVRWQREPAVEPYDATAHATPGDARSPEAEVAEHESVARLQRAVRRLNVSERQIVSLSLEGLSYQEIADVVGISVSHVGVKLHRARSRLKQLLTGGSA